MQARLRAALVGMVLALGLSACGINNVPTLEEQAKSAWSEVQNQYQRRADLIPNLVETVKGYAQQEKDVLIGVTEARAKASSVKVDASIPAPELADVDSVWLFVCRCPSGWLRWAVVPTL